MKTTIEINLRPFTTPNFVSVDTPPINRGDGLKESGSIPLSELDPETLERLCDEFKAEVFKKAGKQMPAIALPA